MCRGGVPPVRPRLSPLSEPRVYEVRLTEPAEVEVETEHARLSDIVSPEYADRWQDGLLAEITRLAVFPALYEIAPENDLYDVPVRRLLYFGPSKKRRGTAYRILFHIIEPTAGEEGGLVRILHVWHGAQQPRF